MINIKTKFGRLALLIMALILVGGQSSAQKRASDALVSSKADKYLSSLSRDGLFSGSVLLAREGRVILSKGYGMANLEYAVPNTPQTKFLLASVTKAFTAVAIMMLHERGRLDINDSICKYVEQCPAMWQAVKLRHLLNHTSGITEFGKPQPENDCFRRTPMTTAQAVERAKQFTPDFTPGEKFAYSSVAFVLLGHVIEKVSGQSYEDFLRANIFEPLKMTGTGRYRQKQITGQRAAGYARAGDGSLSNFDYFNPDYIFAAGSLYSTVEDLYLWSEALHAGKVVGRGTLEQMFTPGLESTGYGWEIFTRKNRRLIRADGRSFGFSNSIATYPSERLTVIVLGNID
ncbi:MAG TPA: serine hydrolase domain-containing protein, partial [Pyrinomonadaceae bacterium]|nr:serine hydrolase domain-containing protein [Pyrinomonadaceae bacterium]